MDSETVHNEQCVRCGRYNNLVLVGKLWVQPQHEDCGGGFLDLSLLSPDRPPNPRPVGKWVEGVEVQGCVPRQTACPVWKLCAGKTVVGAIYWRGGDELWEAYRFKNGISEYMGMFTDLERAKRRIEG